MLCNILSCICRCVCEYTGYVCWVYLKVDLEANSWTYNSYLDCLTQLSSHPLYRYIDSLDSVGIDK